MTYRKLLEALTAAVLLAVAVVLAWMVAASFVPAVAAWVSAESAAVGIILLLTAALLLVSAAALRQTRPRDLP
jgi:hypothetical protein